jgi:DNA repair protein RecN (Recombination protein N)
MNRLRRCTIEDLGLIERAQVVFADGLTAFSGETGSGKTMLLGALKLAFGERASPDVVRMGAQRARVTLEIEPDTALREAFANEGFELEPDEDAILSRELHAGGKSIHRINGRPATAAQLRSFGESLIDFIGQHEHQRLLSGSYQGDVLDRFAGGDVPALRGSIGTAHARLDEIAEEIRALEENAGRAAADAAFARFAVAEIDDARLAEEEETRLRERRDYLANVERIAAALRAARSALSEGEGAATDALGAAASALAAVSRYGDELTLLAATVSALQSEANDAAVALARALDRTEYDPAESEEIGARLDAIERLKKKYGGSVPAVFAARERFAATVEALEGSDERASTLRGERDALAARLAADAARLSGLRTVAARALERGLVAELSVLGMPRARFVVELEPLEATGARGSERAVFTLSPNRGEPARPLAKAASGGELSRVLLALVVVLADRREQSTLVFDEIDAGIGGATAKAVGVRLGTLARTTQVLCVTHLAQIASWADVHVALRKRETRGSTRIEAVALDERASVLEEIARMLSGTTTPVALKHAEALQRDVRAQKKPKLRSA